MNPELEHWSEPVTTVARKDFATIQLDCTVQQALDTIRDRGLGERITYFYVVNDRQELVGVLPTRRLLTSPQEEIVNNIMVERVLTIPETATVLEACEAFVLHKFLAFPIVDYRRRIVGMVDVGLLNEEVFDVAEKQRVDEVFEANGVSRVPGARCIAVACLSVSIPVVACHHRERNSLRAAGERIRVDAGEDDRPGVFPHARSGARRKREYSIHDHHHPGAARHAADLWLVFACAAA
jgi:CBS domain-containing protein